VSRALIYGQRIGRNAGEIQVREARSAFLNDVARPDSALATLGHRDASAQKLLRIWAAVVSSPRSEVKKVFAALFSKSAFLPCL
jgi:hypothetical protein